MNAPPRGRRRRRLILVIVGLLWGAGMWRGVTRAMPPGTSFEGPEREAVDLEFLTDLTYQRDGDARHEQSIFDRIFAMIDHAERFIVLDLFLFNDEHAGDREYLPLSSTLVDHLLARKRAVPGLDITLVTDEINNFYGAYESELLRRLEAVGVEVVITDLRRLRDSNPAYSSIWRAVFQWFGTAGPALAPHPLTSRGRKVTLRSYLKILNFKANHRKLIVTEEGCLVASANPHDASSFHSNIAFAMRGMVCADILAAEQAVAAFSGAVIRPHAIDDPPWADGAARIRFATEGKIRDRLLTALDQTGEGDSVDIAMFYLSHRGVIRALRAAADRGAAVRLILDPNKDAFGREKGGIPNRQVAHELRDKARGHLTIRWFDTHGEQFHTKLVRIRTAHGTAVFGGSANLTRRNIGDYNLEADVIIAADSNLAAQVADYLERLWTNRDGQFTVPYERYEDSSLLKTIVYRLQEFTGFSSY